MIAVRVSKDHRAAIVGSPAYFKSHQKPKAPRDLLTHRCINFRHGHGGDIYRWEFEKGRKSLSVAVNGPLIVDDVEIVIRAALTAKASLSSERTRPVGISRAAHSSACSTIGASRSPDSFFITRADDSSQPRWRL